MANGGKGCGKQNVETYLGTWVLPTMFLVQRVGRRVRVVRNSRTIPTKRMPPTPILTVAREKNDVDEDAVSRLPTTKWLEEEGVTERRQP